MSDSILTSTKKNLNLDEDYTYFDPDIIMYINGAFSTLHQLGMGPAEGFMIEDKNAEWADYLEDDARLNNVKTYVSLVARLHFDPPVTSFHLSSMKEQVKELEWRINTQVEPARLPELEPSNVIDGGDA